ncbi:ABC-type transport auxiliary lipoprotein family protein [Lysobacter cavernae]|uniref:ABC-type transport auxiliary lipoprotein family protein n=1 Tax=Lysobacter cavernae TaxID=1685901 RepID=A0ABV7RRY1_9GAMM
MTTRQMSCSRPWRRTLGTALALLALAGCSILSDKPSDRSTTYILDPRVPADPTWPSAQWQLALTSPEASRTIDSLRIAVRPVPNEIQAYKGARWSRLPSGMLEDTVLRALEDSGRIPAVARQGTGVGAQYKLVMEIRRFESDYAGTAAPVATIEVVAKLLHNQDQQIVATRTFEQKQPPRSSAVPDVVVAFEQALGTMSHDITGWTLASGNAHEATHRR